MSTDSPDVQLTPLATATLLRDVSKQLWEGMLLDSAIRGDELVMHCAFELQRAADVLLLTMRRNELPDADARAARAEIFRGMFRVVPSEEP